MGEKGIEGARKVASKIKKESEADRAQEQKEMAVVVKNLADLSKNEELAKMFNSSANVGADNLAGELPLLKVHQAGKSTRNELSTGGRPNDGWFFYKLTGEQFESIDCHVLTISKGFRAEGLQEGKNVFNQILGGVIINEGQLKPFVMYFTGLKLKNLWEFGKQASKYTHLKPVAIPMFALTIKLTTEQVTNNFGESWIVNFEIVKDEDGTPNLVTDPGEFAFLRDHVMQIEDTLTSLIETKTVKSDEDRAVEVPPQTPNKGNDDGDEEPIPF